MGKWEVLDMTVGARLEDFYLYHGNIRVVIMRGTHSLCAYVGVPIGHPIAGLNYNDLPLRCHWGLTFGKEGTGDYLPERWWWYGWDYAHCDDACSYEFNEDGSRKAEYLHRGGSKEWTVKEVHDEAIKVAEEFNQLKLLAEQVFIRTKGWGG